jgi:pimeloyl-ACP methyl ester carboxylesterase
LLRCNEVTSFVSQAVGLTAFEFARPETPSEPENTLLFIGGLFDGFLTVPYIIPLSSQLPSSYRLVQVYISSSYKGWGTGSLIRDTQELAQCVKYFRNLQGKGGKVVLMGHSTGCQDTMEYCVGLESPGRLRSVESLLENLDVYEHQVGSDGEKYLDAAILQSPVSDREALLPSFPGGEEAYRASCTTAQEWVDRGDGEEVLPSKLTGGFFPAPTSARRFLSLASPDKDGADDFFSSDLPDATLKKSFGKWPKDVPLLVLYGGKDQYVPEYVDKAALVKRWAEIVKGAGATIDEENGGIVAGANHNLKGVDHKVVDDLIGRVRRFLEKVENSSNI